MRARLVALLLLIVTAGSASSAQDVKESRDSEVMVVQAEPTPRPGPHSATVNAQRNGQRPAIAIEAETGPLPDQRGFGDGPYDTPRSAVAEPSIVDEAIVVFIALLLGAAFTIMWTSVQLRRMNKRIANLEQRKFESTSSDRPPRGTSAEEPAAMAAGSSHFDARDDRAADEIAFPPTFPLAEPRQRPAAPGHHIRRNRPDQDADHGAGEIEPARWERRPRAERSGSPPPAPTPPPPRPLPQPPSIHRQIENVARNYRELIADALTLSSRFEDVMGEHGDLASVAISGVGEMACVPYVPLDPGRLITAVLLDTDNAVLIPSVYFAKEFTGTFTETLEAGPAINQAFRLEVTGAGVLSYEQPALATVGPSGAITVVRQGILAGFLR